MKNLLNGIFIISVFMFFTACKKSTNACSPARTILPVFIGFTPNAISEIAFIRYPQGNLLGQGDTSIIKNPDIGGGGIYTTSNDSTIVYANSFLIGIFSGNDWKIYLPVVSKTITITNIVSPQVEGDDNCTDPINSFDQDGNTVPSPVYFNTNDDATQGYRAYIHP